MKVAIMQPYFFPYGGYFQLMTHLDDKVVDRIRRDRVHLARRLVIQNDPGLPAKDASKADTLFHAA